MERRARATVFWPGMTQDVKAARNSYVHCNRIAPSRAAVPHMPINAPTIPFELIFADFFDYGGRHFLVIGYKFLDCADVFGTSSGSNMVGAAVLIRLVRRTYFATFGVSEEVSTDGGPDFTAFATQQFFTTCVAKDRVSSAKMVCHRAKMAVKAAKRPLMANVSPSGDLNNDSFLPALLQLRNNPDPNCDMSPAEIVFGRPLQDAFSFANRLPTVN